jgi:hypothetical protein
MYDAPNVFNHGVGVIERAISFTQEAFMLLDTRLTS